MITLEDQLRELGDRLAVPEARPLDVDALYDAAHDGDGPVRDRVAWMKVAAVLVALAVGVVVAVPSSRRTVADWFGFDGVDLERDPRVDPPAEPDPFGATPGTVVDVDGRPVLFSEFDGSLAPEGLRKTLGDGSDVAEITVGDAPGVWVDGEPHEVSYRDRSGELVFERFAGNTLLWQRGHRVARLEGFDDREVAIAYALDLTR